MYCKVCFDAGKPEEVVKSHWVKNQFGMVICPTLLTQNCLRCGFIGHTPAYCVNIPIAHMASEPETKKFCPVCHKRGALHHEYTDHNLSEDGVVVCEYLLNLECRNCGEKGHTPKYCPEPKQKSPTQKLRESQNLACRIEDALKLPTKAKKGFVRIL